MTTQFELLLGGGLVVPKDQKLMNAETWAAEVVQHIQNAQRHEGREYNR
jgi:hypothetical protein